MIRAALRRLVRTAPRAAKKRRYQLTGRRPWTPGYWEYRQDFIRRAVADSSLAERFRSTAPLPGGYGVRLDERVIEYPWMLARLSPTASRLMDAGSALNFDFLLAHPALQRKSVIIYTLAPEGTVSRPNVSYIYGDLRQTLLRDGVFDEIACISTIEHVGLNNTMLYTGDRRHDESRPSDYRVALREFHRLLAPGGRLLLTVPFGKYQHLGWFQQFDRDVLTDAVRAFGGSLEEETFYRYTAGGWVLSHAEACAGLEYHDVHAGTQANQDHAAAARAVACVVLSR
jgi:hypothetical protein